MQRAPGPPGPRLRRLTAIRSLAQGPDAGNHAAENAERSGCQPSGIRGALSVTKSVGAGGRGGWWRRMPASSSVRLPLRRLHGAHEVTTLSQTDSPPFDRGITWSSVSLPLSVPQYWHLHLSRAKSARREIFRWMDFGTRT